MHWLEQIEQHIGAKYGVIAFASLETDGSVLIQMVNASLSRHELEELCADIHRFAPGRKIRVGILKR